MLLTLRYFGSLHVKKLCRLREPATREAVWGSGAHQEEHTGGSGESPFPLQCLFSTLYLQNFMPQGKGKIFKGPKFIFAEQAVEGEFGAVGQ